MTEAAPRERPYAEIDVFSAVAYRGNPVGVVLDAEGLSDAAMQRFAQWTNFSETTFVLPPRQSGADYRVRIFTPKAELPFAGHPTLGTAHAVIAAGLAHPRGGSLVQDCAAGLVALSVDGGRIAFRLPRYALDAAPGGAEATAWIGAALRGHPRAVDVGPVWLVAELELLAELEALQPDALRLIAYYEAHGLTGATLFAADDGRVVVRSFAPGDGIPEDPVCGSGNAAVAAYRLAAGQIGDGSAYCASQGRQVGRDGKVYVRIIGTEIEVGGDCVGCVRGTVLL